MLRMMCAAPRAVAGQSELDERAAGMAAAAEELSLIAARLARLAGCAGPAGESREEEGLRAAIAGRRRRVEQFGQGLFGDPGWDIMLALFAAHREGRGLEPSALYAASAVAPSAALSWLDRLVEKGLIARTDDPRQGRRLRITLTQSGADRMRACLGGG